MQTFHSHSLPARQQGAALITGLLIMTIMTLIGLASMQSSIIQTNLATNSQLKTISYQAVEAALTHATSFDYLSKSLLPVNLQTGTTVTLATTTDLNNVAYTATSTSGQTSAPTNSGQVDVKTSGSVKLCGALPPKLVKGLSLDANQSANNTSFTRYVFDLETETEVSTQGRVQTRSRHAQRSTRLMINNQGGMPLCNI